jgi:hypothetical protein
MRRRAGLAALIVVAGMVLGATVFREQVAQAAMAVLKVQVVNPTTSPVPVHEQGTANVNVTNPNSSPVPVAPQGTQNVTVTNPNSSPVPVAPQGTQNVNVTNGSLAVGPPAPVPSGGQRLQVDAGQTTPIGSAITASALVIQFRNGATELLFRRNGEIAARFPGPGPIVLALTQPIRFDELQCGGPSGFCDVGWAGSAG